MFLFVNTLVTKVYRSYGRIVVVIIRKVVMYALTKLTTNLCGIKLKIIELQAVFQTIISVIQLIHHLI